MNLIVRYTLFCFVSLIMHVVILYLMSFNILPDYLKTHKDIEVVIIKTPVSEPSSLTQKKVDEKGIHNEKVLPDLEKKTQKDTEIIRPVVNMPKMDLNKKIEFSSPKYSVSQTNKFQNLKVYSHKALDKEIERVQKSIGVSDNPKSSRNDVVDNDFFELKGLSNKNRKLVYIPENKGTFKLETDTNLTLSFTIDKSGRPYNITFVNRSFSEIENIAMDFVKQLRFEAVDYDKVDKAEIVLHFKVK